MDDHELCYRAAIRILKFRFNSAAELRRKLKAKQFGRETIDAAIARLTNERWIDDARFAAAFVRTRLQKRIGRLRIRRELIAAGVADDIIDEAIRDNVDAEIERERALVAASKKRTMPRNKLTAYLLKQGYDAALVRDVVRDVTHDDN